MSDIPSRETWKQSWLDLLALGVSLSDAATVGIDTHITVMQHLIDRIQEGNGPYSIDRADTIAPM